MNPCVSTRRVSARLAFLLVALQAAAALPPTASAGPCYVPIVEEAPRTSWVFMRSRYTNDPETGARVAQYAMKPPIEPLDDPRLVTSGYTRTRTVIRGADGSSDTIYRVTNYGNGRGGLDAEWERVHDAWRGSTVAGGQVSSGYGGYGGFGGGFVGGGFPGWGVPGWGPWRQFPPGYNFQNGPLGQGGAYGFGPGYNAPDAGRLDPDAADGYREIIPRTPDKEFFNRHVPGAQSSP